MNFLYDLNQHQIQTINLVILFAFLPMGLMSFIKAFADFPNRKSFMINMALGFALLVPLLDGGGKLTTRFINNPVGSFSFNGNSLNLNNQEVKKVDCKELSLRACEVKLKEYVAINNILGQENPIIEIK